MFGFKTSQWKMLEFSKPTEPVSNHFMARGNGHYGITIAASGCFGDHRVVQPGNESCTYQCLLV